MMVLKCSTCHMFEVEGFLNFWMELVHLFVQFCSFSSVPFDNHVYVRNPAQGADHATTCAEGAVYTHRQVV